MTTTTLTVAKSGGMIDEARVWNPGAYAGNAALLDAAGVERTTWVNINPFTILSNSDISISVDFPANSFQ